MSNTATVEAEPKPKKAKKEKKPTLAVLSTIPAQNYCEYGPARDLCVQCGRGATVDIREKFVPKGYTARLLVVFEKPPTPEEYKLVSELANEAGYKQIDWAYVSAVRCNGDTPDMKQIRCCRPFVLRAIDFLKPELVVALGPAASRSLTNLGSKTNVTKLRGRPLLIAGRPDVQAYVTYAPSSVLLGGLSNRQRIVEDFKRASEAKLAYPHDAVPTYPDRLGVDTEYAPDGTLLTVGQATSTAAKAVEPEEPEFYDTLANIAGAREGCILVGHSLSGDVDKLVELGIARDEWVSGIDTLDSLLLSRMHDENRAKGGYDLESLLTSDRKVDPWKYKTEAYDKKDATTWPPDLRKERCRLDAWASVVVADDMAPRVRGEGQPIELTHRVAMSLHRVELAGVYIDVEKFLDMESELRAEQQHYKDKLTKLAHSRGMTSFTPTNDDDIRTLLFKKMKLEVIKKTKKDKLASVDKTTLKQYIGLPEVDALIEFNKADKALSTNIVGLKDLIIPDNGLGYLPVHINPLGARTGRRSSERPNMQNWQQKLRQMVVSRYRGGSILEFDYKSLEVFLLAFEANDDKLYDYFATKGGYIAIAKDMWKTDVKKGSNEYRATKSVVLGTNYNMQTGLMAENLWFMGVRFSSDYDEHEQQTDKLRNAYLDMFPGLRPYMAKQRSILLKNQRVWTRTGRVRHLPHTGKNTVGFGRLVNQAINYPIQGFAADVTGSGLVDCETVLCGYSNLDLVEYHGLVLERGWHKNPVPLIVNEVHDNLVFDLPWGVEDRRTKEVSAMLKETMESVRTLRALVPSFTMPLRVDMKLGPHWGMEE